MINDTFSECKKVGYLIATLCSQLIKKELNFNLAQQFTEEWNSPIFSKKFTIIDEEIWQLVSRKSRKKFDEWVKVANSLVLKSYHHALVFKDFIGS